MDVRLAIASRRETRDYADRELPADVVERILDAGRLAGAPTTASRGSSSRSRIRSCVPVWPSRSMRRGTCAGEARSRDRGFRQGPARLRLRPGGAEHALGRLERGSRRRFERDAGSGGCRPSPRARRRRAALHRPDVRLSSAPARPRVANARGMEQSGQPQASGSSSPTAVTTQRLEGAVASRPPHDPPDVRIAQNPQTPARAAAAFVVTALVAVALAGTADARLLKRLDYDSGNFRQWRAKQAVPGGAKIVRSPRRQGRYAARFVVRPGDDPIDASGERAEVWSYTNERAGKSSWWKWSTFFPKDFRPAATGGTSSPSGTTRACRASPRSVRGGLLRQPPSTPTARKRRAAERVQPVVPQGVQPWAAPAGTLDHVRLPRPLVALQEPRVRRGLAKRQEGAAVQTRPDALRRHLRLREAGLLPSSDALDETPSSTTASAATTAGRPRFATSPLGTRARARARRASRRRPPARMRGSRHALDRDVLVLVDVRRVDSGEAARHEDVRVLGRVGRYDPEASDLLPGRGLEAALLRELARGRLGGRLAVLDGPRRELRGRALRPRLGASG